MRIFKNKSFNKWAAEEGISDAQLETAVDEIKRGLIDANLGGDVLKKRVASGGKGKRGGSRTLLAYQSEKKVFFIYGFAKNVRDNISKKELTALKLYAEQLLGLNDNDLKKAMRVGEIVEIKGNKKEGKADEKINT